jgi:hypothetical protein
MIMRAWSGICVLLLTLSVSGQTRPDFTGRWREQTSSTQRDLEIEQKGQNLRVTTVVTDSGRARKLEVKYQIGGPQTDYKGLDGDDFRSTVHWDASRLVFDIIEHEGSSVIPQKTIWTLSPDGKALQVDRDVTKSEKTTHSSATYFRQP